MRELVGRRQLDESPELAFRALPPPQAEVRSSESFPGERRAGLAAHCGLECCDLIGREVGLNRRCREERRLRLRGWLLRRVDVVSCNGRPHAEAGARGGSDDRARPCELPRNRPPAPSWNRRAWSRGCTLASPRRSRDAGVGEQRPCVSCEPGVDENEFGRDRSEEVHERDDFDLAPMGVRLGVVRPERFHDCHELSALFRSRKPNPPVEADAPNDRAPPFLGRRLAWLPATRPTDPIAAQESSGAAPRQ